VRYGELFVQYHKRDEPEVVYLEELIASTYAHVCAVTLCPKVNTLTVDFTVASPVYHTPYLEADPEHEGRDRIVLSSPWLSGMPVDGESWDEAYIERLVHAVVYATTTRAMRSTTKRELNPLREAVADEYATWFAQGETSDLVLLRPIIEQQGTQAMSAVLRSAKASSTSSQFLERWLGLGIDEGEIARDGARKYFESLLNLERQALRAGRKQTFLMLQDTDWHSAQARYFDRVQQSGAPVPRAEIRVRGAQVLRGHARLQLSEQLPAYGGQPPQSVRNVVYYRLEDGDWRHTSVLDAFFWTLQPAPTPAAVSPLPVPTGTPTPSPNA
jgi:hypothetical protein